MISNYFHNENLFRLFLKIRHTSMMSTKSTRNLTIVVSKLSRIMNIIRASQTSIQTFWEWTH